MFDRNAPFNDLPALPPAAEVETAAVLKKAIAAGRALAELKGMAERMPKGKIAFSRYANEATYPDASTTLLLTMAIAMPDSLKWLADKAGVEIPLWRERLEDAVAEPLNPKNMPAQRGGLEGA